MTAQVIKLQLVADHSGGAAHALDALTQARATPTVLTLVKPLPCERCENPECRRVENWAKYEACERGNATEEVTDLSFEVALISERACIPVQRMRMIPVEDIERDQGGNIIETRHEIWKESRL